MTKHHIRNYQMAIIWIISIILMYTLSFIEIINIMNKIYFLIAFPIVIHIIGCIAAHYQYCDKYMFILQSKVYSFIPVILFIIHTLNI